MNSNEWIEKKLENTDWIYPLQLSTFNEIMATIASMNSTQDEILVEVDKDNNEIESVLKEKHTVIHEYIIELLI